MDNHKLKSIIERIANVEIACIGDVMLDHYVYGEVGRISPEAPIPVLRRHSDNSMLGGVGNVARNILALGGCVQLAGLVGADAAAETIKNLLSQESSLTQGLITLKNRSTTVKTRFVASGQQLLRLDEESDLPLDAESEARWISHFSNIIKRSCGIVISDYAKGAITPGVIAAALTLAKANNIPILVDPKGRSFAKYGPVDLIKPNAKELGFVTDLPVATDEEVSHALEKALAVCEAKAILVTRAGQGMSLARRGEAVIHFRARAQAVFDVSGAGDTAIAALATALAANVDLADAVSFAILTSGFVVGKTGTAVVTPQELLEANHSHDSREDIEKWLPLDQALTKLKKWKTEGLKIGFTNGCFDILHRGHVAYLHQARQWCDRLVLALNSDHSIQRLKGEGRPVNDLESRAFVLSGLSSVDLIVDFENDTPLELIRRIQPDILIKGADYHEKDVVGANEVRSWGGDVRLADLIPNHSTTRLIGQMTKAG